MGLLSPVVLVMTTVTTRTPPFPFNFPNKYLLRDKTHSLFPPLLLLVLSVELFYSTTARPPSSNGTYVVLILETNSIYSYRMTRNNIIVTHGTRKMWIE